MFFSGLENRLFEARLWGEFTIFPLENISIQLFYYRARLFIEGDKGPSHRRE